MRRIGPRKVRPQPITFDTRTWSCCTWWRHVCSMCQRGRPGPQMEGGPHQLSSQRMTGDPEGLPVRAMPSMPETDDELGASGPCQGHGLQAASPSTCPGTRGCPVCTHRCPVSTRNSPACTRGCPVCTRGCPVCTYDSPACTHGDHACTQLPCLHTHLGESTGCAQAQSQGDKWVWGRSPRSPSAPRE